MNTRRPQLFLPSEIVDANATSSAPIDPLAKLEKGLADLTVRFQANEAALAEIHRRQDEAARGKASPKALPRPLRVLRRRLRQFGLWSDGRAKKADLGGVLGAARALAPTPIKPFFDKLAPYEAWMAANRVTAASVEDLRTALASAAALPRISILTPVFNTRPDYLQETVRSVLGQIYDNWQLCLVDDGSTSPETIAALAAVEGSDPRILVHRRATNGGISNATNEAAEIATGEILLFLDHDDLLTPDCLAELALYYSAHPAADLVYSDDDKIDDSGRRYAPQFKPDWSPVLLLSFMYLSHALTVRRSLFLALGGFRSRFDGSQDYDFALRAAEHARHVGHVPRILYHWRAAPGSTAVSGDAKPESFRAGREAVQEALDRRGVQAVARQPDWAAEAKVGMFSLDFPDDGPSVTLVVPTYNRADLLGDCIASLKQTTYSNYEVLIIDNGSDEADALALLAELAQAPRTTVLRVPRRPEGFNFSALMNKAVAAASGEYVLFLNNDTSVINPRWLSQMVGYGQIEGVGCVGAQLRFGDDSVQHAGIVHGLNDGLVGHAFRHAPTHDWGYMGFIRTAREYSGVTAACMLTRRDLFIESRGFDVSNFAVAYNDVDYCFRLVEDGYSCVYCPDALLFHYEGKTRGYSDNPIEVANLRRLYGDWRDPWYNPNLSLDSDRFEIGARRLPMRARRPVRAVFISHNLSREGAPNTLFDLIAGLKAAGIVDPLVLSPRDGPLRDDYEQLDVDVRLFTEPAREAAAFESGLERLAKVIQGWKAEVVVANTLRVFYGVNAAARAETPAIWLQHESEPWETYFDYLEPGVRSFAYAAFGQAYRTTYVAEATRRAWTGVQTRQSSQIIRHGVPPVRLAEEVGRWSRDAARAALGVREDETVLCLLGTVCRRKGQLDLAQAIKPVMAASARPVRCFIAGAVAEADYEEQIRAVVAEVSGGDQALTVTGSVADMAPYYAAADVIVCTSRMESAPRVMIEAMAFALPIVTTPVFGIPEMVRLGINALFYSPGDVDDLAQTLLSLVSDPERGRTMGKAGAAVLASLPGYRDMVETYAQIIREAALLKDDRPTF